MPAEFYPLLPECQCFIPDANIVLSAGKKAALVFVRQEVRKKKWLQASESSTILKSQPLRTRYSRTAVILQKVGHPHVSKEGNTKAGCQVPDTLLLALRASAAF